jgi:hypothetical protein
MKIVDPTSVPAREFGRSPDDVDQLLRSYFQEETPKSWPAFAGEPTPAARQPWASTAHSKRSLLRSRLVLAASIVLILMSAWWLGGRFSITESSTLPSATGTVIGAKERQNKARIPKVLPEEKRNDSPGRSHP